MSQFIMCNWCDACSGKVENVVFLVADTYLVLGVCLQWYLMVSLETFL